MAAPFDHIATSFDTLFARGAVDQLQRKQVWSYVEKITPQLRGLEILELNCGTGEDAMLFCEKGFNIVATDVSEEMLKVMAKKANQFSMQNRVSSQYLEVDGFDETIFDKRFDLIFSNFGGLNCINPESFQKLLRKLPSILSPGGRFVGVVMPKFCLWETSYHLLKFRFKQAFRRLTDKEVILDLEGTDLKVWHYNPSQIRNWSGKKFKEITTKPIGFALPPANLVQHFIKRKRLLLRLQNLGKKVENVSFLSGMADYFLIDLALK